MSDATDEQAAFDREHAALLLDAQRRMQDGVTSHAQLVASGLSRIDIERGVRRNELRRVHPRVYVNHTGPLTWEQRAWAAVLYADPAVLCWGVSRRRRDATTGGRSMSPSTIPAR